MIFYPAIDLKDGQCVRLLQGDMATATVFNDDPAAQARAFADAGCRWLHVVDLDGAFAGKPMNRDAVASILAAIDVPVQLGGGIRDLETVAGWLDAGVARVVMGTAAIKDPALVDAAARRFPGRVAVGIDAKDGLVATEGWAEVSQTPVIDLARRFAGQAAAYIYTDIARDGAMAGPNVDATARLAAAVDVPVIASGGVSSLDDLRALRDAGSIAGAICGRSVYDGRVPVADAIALLDRPAPSC